MKLYPPWCKQVFFNTIIIYCETFIYDSRQLGAPRFGQKTPPLTQWRFESKKCFHNVKIKMKRVSGYAIMSDHNEGFFLAAIPVRST